MGLVCWALRFGAFLSFLFFFVSSGFFLGKLRMGDELQILAAIELLLEQEKRARREREESRKLSRGEGR